MVTFFYTIAVILIIFWAIGFFAYSAGSISIYLVIAVIILFRLISGRKESKKKIKQLLIT
jgi:hypothetical protein